MRHFIIKKKYWCQFFSSRVIFEIVIRYSNFDCVHLWVIRGLYRNHILHFIIMMIKSLVNKILMKYHLSYYIYLYEMCLLVPLLRGKARLLLVWGVLNPTLIIPSLRSWYFEFRHAIWLIKTEFNPRNKLRYFHLIKPLTICAPSLLIKSLRIHWFKRLDKISINKTWNFQ